MPHKATREESKLYNKRLVLKLIYDRGPLSRADAARVTGLSKTTVSSAVAELLATGVISEVGRATTTGGKPATLLSLAERARNLIGLDLAESEFAGALTDLRGSILYRASLPVPGTGREETLASISTLIHDLRSHARAPILGIGVGVPGAVNVLSGEIRSSVHFDWNGLPLRDILSRRWRVPVYLANDSQAAALGEYMFGAHTTRNLVVLRVALGVSAGIVLDGHIHSGDDGLAGEIGHITIVPGGELCVCGRRGCLETIVSRHALLARAREIARGDPDSILARLAGDPARIESVDVVLRAFHAGDPAVRARIAEMGAALGLALTWLVGVLNVECIVVAGSLVRFGPLLIEAMCQTLQTAHQPIMTDKLTVRESRLGGDIVICGAAALVLSNQLGVV